MYPFFRFFISVYGYTSVGIVGSSVSGASFYGRNTIARAVRIMEQSPEQRAAQNRILWDFPNTPEGIRKAEEYTQSLVQRAAENRILWDLPNTSDGIMVAEEYTHTLWQSSYYATAIEIPMKKDDVSGVIVACSNGQSTTQMKYNHEQYSNGDVILEPHWLLYDVWWFPGKAFLNFHGITDTIFQGTQLSGTLGTLLRSVLGDRMSDYCRITSGYYKESLRRLLRDAFNAPTWAEYTVGRSMRAFYGLDFYVSVHSVGMEVPLEEAWYLLNVERMPFDRPRYKPEDWWTCNVHVSIGQRAAVDEWVLEATQVSIRPGEPSPAYSRLERVYAQCAPDGNAVPAHLIPADLRRMMERHEQSLVLRRARIARASGPQPSGGGGSVRILPIADRRMGKSKL